jgi:hypothetical protein
VCNRCDRTVRAELTTSPNSKRSIVLLRGATWVAYAALVLAWFAVVGADITVLSVLVVAAGGAAAAAADRRLQARASSDPRGRTP